MAQIIDENACVAAGLPDYLDRIGITRSGLDYHIISIIGAQSSGKSTLLNHLFGTSFATMNETTGRQQTTKGIHAAYADKMLIFDIEGSDSRERGDADALFERKSALFALALSEVVMVNMWQNDIGRYNASSIPLLKTVFEVNLQLFATSSDTKCHLLFVIRDSTNDTKVIEGQVKRDLDSIWSQLTLPQSLAGRPFEDFFVFHFFPLPHYRLMRPAFDKSVKDLNARFLDKSNEGFLFREQTGKVIPGDGLYQYVISVWEAITENRELNMPSQRRTLSSFRCDGFAKEALLTFGQKVVDAIAIPLGEKRLSAFGEPCRQLIEEALAMYDAKAERYVKDIVQEKREAMVDKMGEMLEVYFSNYCRDSVQREEEGFSEQLKSVGFADVANWEEMMTARKNEALEAVFKTVKEASVNNYPWVFDLTDFEPHLDSMLRVRLEANIRDLERAVYENSKVEYLADVDEVLKKADPNMWEVLRARMNEMIRECRKKVQDQLAVSTKCSEPTGELDVKIQKLTAGRALNASQYIQNQMKDRFDSIFMRDESGKAREWKGDDDVSELFEQARDAGLGILRMFSARQLREPGEMIPPHDILTERIISPMNAQSWEQKFVDEIEKKYIEAVRIRESNKIRMNIPWQMWVAFVVFGYDKIIAAIYHPFWAFLVLCALGAIWYLYSHRYLDSTIELVAKLLAKAIAFILTLIRGHAPPKKRSKPKRKKVMTRCSSEFQLDNDPKPAPAAPAKKKLHRKKKAMARHMTLAVGDMERRSKRAQEAEVKSRANMPKPQAYAMIE